MNRIALILSVLIIIAIGAIAFFLVHTYRYRGETLTGEDRYVLEDCHQIVAQAQKWYRKPPIIGGATKGFVGLKFSLLGKPDDVTSNAGMTWRNENGTYTISNAIERSFTLTAEGHNGLIIRFLAVTGNSVPEPMITRTR